MINNSIRFPNRSPVGTALAATALALSVVVAACDSPSAASPPAANPGAASTTVGPSGDSASRVASAPSVTAVIAISARSTAAEKANANTTSQDEVARILAARGVPNAARWAREVVEYRPYPTDDPSFGKLRQELAKYYSAPEVVEQIVASLSL